ncbi:transposase, partial [Staphylococcus aureus]
MKSFLNQKRKKSIVKLYECDDCSACSLRQQCMKPNSKSNKKIMKNYN